MIIKGKRKVTNENNMKNATQTGYIPHYTLDVDGKILYQNKPNISSVQVFEDWKGTKKSIDGRLALIDRDGVIVEKAPPHQYHISTKTITIIDGTAKAIKYLNDKNIPVILVTNQQGISKGLFGNADLFNIDSYIQEQLRSIIPDVRIDGVIYCPHAKVIEKDSGKTKYLECTCRKPAPGMLKTIMAMYSVSESKTFMFGDTASDIEAAVKAGVSPVYISTKHDEYVENEQAIQVKHPKIFHKSKYHNLLDAVTNIFK